MLCMAAKQHDTKNPEVFHLFFSIVRFGNFLLRDSEHSVEKDDAETLVQSLQTLPHFIIKL